MLGDKKGNGEDWLITNLFQYLFTIHFMRKALIKLTFRQIIDSSSQDDFEKKIFDDTYDEFLMQVQAYNSENKYKIFSEVLASNPKAGSLHYKVGFSIGLYIRELDNKIPGLKDSLGHSSLMFSAHTFEIVESDITNKSAHKVAITYTTDILTLLDNAGEYLLLASGDQSENASKHAVETFLLRIVPNLSIVEYQEIPRFSHSFDNSFLNS